MRLHSLEITAFGPFADTVTVDVDALSAAGLFLLTGPTGSGKSSVLDAVCFALYGDVPGDRGTAKRLRCDRAPVDRAPRVVLEATLAGRRFRIDRSPAWERPKRRGSGTTTQQSTVAISEWVGDGWTTRSTRIDETGHLVTSLVGMTLTQFCQVALLPQGRFEAFLRARSDERHALLARVFRTGRFEAVERWLRDHRSTTRRAAQALEDRVLEVINRLSETSDTARPESWDDLTLVGDGEITAWAERITTEAVDRASSGGALVQAASAAEASARDDLESGSHLARRQRAHAEALAEHTRLEAQRPAHDGRVAELEAARRAATVLPLTALVDEARAALADADEELADLDVTGADPTQLHADAAELSTQITLVRATLPRERELADLEQARNDQLIAVGEAREAHTSCAAEAARLPAQLEEARRSLAAVDQAAARLPGVQAELAAVAIRVEAHHEVTRLVEARRDAEALHMEARTTVQAAREAWLTVREARLDGMAAELARDLAVGDHCPVCGSDDHPQPARARAGAPDAAAEKAARGQVDDAEAELHLRDEHLRDLDRRLAAARGRAGDDAEADLVERRAHLAAECEAVSSRADGRDVLAAELESGQQRLADLTAEVDRRADAVRAAQEALATTHARVTDAREVVGVMLDDTGHQHLADLLADLLSEHGRVQAVTAALDARAAAQRDLDRARTAADEAARDAGFESVIAAREAARASDAMTSLERRLQTDRDALAHARRMLDDADLVTAAATPAPDLQALTHAWETATEALRAAERDHAVAARRHQRLLTLSSDLGRALGAWTPARDDHALAARMAALVDGSASDNRLRMRLSAYVLAHRLGQVVAAANERLAAMSDQRYRLEHTGQRSAGETRGGLSLQVRDDWSGEARDPATLSGGETFVVALALALGLADVITQEAGGADLDTLFVDEGFGSLDAETLDQVMDHLDSLREGGRTVGVVSHVEEMRDRIPAQLRVAKQRAGSTVSVHAGAVG